jgi:hypothetical protein
MAAEADTPISIEVNAKKAFAHVKSHLYVRHRIDPSTLARMSYVDIIGTIRNCVCDALEYDSRIMMRIMYNIADITITSIVRAHVNDQYNALVILYRIMRAVPAIFELNQVMKVTAQLRNTICVGDSIIIAPLISFIITHPNMRNRFTMIIPRMHMLDSTNRCVDRKVAIIINNSICNPGIFRDACEQDDVGFIYASDYEQEDEQFCDTEWLED